MEEENLKEKYVNGAKWSTITEVLAKIVTPITNMVLARIISPEAFGVVATVTMIMSFAEMFTDAGFQKYLVQHEFKDEEEKFKNANVAFWTNFEISIFLWIIIIIFRNELAFMVGNPGLGNVIVIACFELLLTSFSSIQMALYRRDFDFKTLFLVRMVSIFIPFAVTIPLALLGFSYWSLVIGSIVMQSSNVIILTVKSKWKPSLFYEFGILKKMLSFSIWSLIEAISIWFTAWVDMFIIGSSLNQYYLGIYKTSISMVNALLALITSSIVPVLFTALSRLQNNKEKFNKLYFDTQKIVSILVFPLGVGMYLYSDLATKILLGSKWSEASKVIGVWSLTSVMMIVFGNLCSEVYRAKGRPKLSFLSQILHIIVLIPVCIIGSKHGFWILVYARAWIRMEFVIVHFIIMKVAIGIPVGKTVRNIFPTLISAVVMGVLGHWLRQISNEILWGFISIPICSVIYFSILYIFPDTRRKINEVVKKLKNRFLPNRYKAIKSKVV